MTLILWLMLKSAFLAGERDGCGEAATQADSLLRCPHRRTLC
jgi:hypothetical protein